MPCLLTSIRQCCPELQTELEAVTVASTMVSLVWATWTLSHALGVRIIEAVLTARAQAPIEWPSCPQCGQGLESRGVVPRTLKTRLGVIRWRRRIGRCKKNGCSLEAVAPLDDELELEANQATSTLLMRDACLLAAYIPYETTTHVLAQLYGISLSSSSVWNWVQKAGAKAMVELHTALTELADGAEPTPEQMEAAIARLRLLIGADGVMVPFRPHPGTPRGRTVWREIKVGVVARMEAVRGSGERVSRLVHRRLVAVLGSVDELAPRLKLEAIRCRMADATQVVWISDGARGLWRIRAEYFPEAIAILDFYHAAQNLAQAAESWFGAQPISVHLWFVWARRQLRDGCVTDVIDKLRGYLVLTDESDEQRGVLSRVAAYLDRHREHLRFPEYDQLGLPLGSGFVESACKWLIQQRFKGVGMRWSEDGFNHLLMLRLASANDRFDQLFLGVEGGSP